MRAIGLDVNFGSFARRMLVGLSVVAVFIAVLSPVAAQTDPPSLTTVSKGKWTTDLVGGGFTPNIDVTIWVTDNTGQDVELGTVGTDTGGNFNASWANQYSGAAAMKIGSTVHAKQGDTDVTLACAKDYSDPSVWNLWGLLANAGPLETVFTNTDLAAAGFSGTVDLVSVSANAQIVSETTTFNSPADKVRTIGYFNALAAGPVIGTYQAVGTFTHLFDPSTGDPITGPVTLTDSSDAIGEIIVPEPATLWLTLAGVCGLLGYARRPRKAKA